MALETIALWWCYVTGAALAAVATCAAWWWAIETFLKVTGNTHKVVQWYWDKLRAANADKKA